MSPWVVVLAGGLGTRLGKIHPETPKGLLSTSMGSVVDHVLDLAKKNNISNVHFCLGHLSDKYVEYFERMNKKVPRISYTIESEPLGTGGAVKNALADIEGDMFFLLNGDTFLDAKLDKLLLRKDEADLDGKILCCKMGDASDYGSVVLGDSGYVESFREKGQETSGFVNAGLYCLRKKTFSEFKKEKFSLEHELLGQLKLKAVIAEKSFMDIGTPERLKKARSSE